MGILDAHLVRHRVCCAWQTVILAACRLLSRPTTSPCFRDAVGEGTIVHRVLFWWIVLGNLARTVPFGEQRLITEGVIHINACLCTLLAVFLPRAHDRGDGTRPGRACSRRPRLVGFWNALVVVVGEFAIVTLDCGATPSSGTPLAHPLWPQCDAGQALAAVAALLTWSVVSKPTALNLPGIYSSTRVLSSLVIGSRISSVANCTCTRRSPGFERPGP